jgi:hypothetical protein
MLLSIDVKNNLVLHPEIVKLVDSFQVLEEKELLYVALYADYESIYKQFPEHERKRKAMWHAFSDNVQKVIESKRIQDAIQDYIGCQYSHKREIIQRNEKKIDKLLDQQDVDESSTSIIKTQVAIAALRSANRELESEVNDDIQNQGVIKGKMTLSHLEKIMANRKYYKSIIAKK